MSDKKASTILLERLQEALDTIGNTNEEIARELMCDHSTINKWYNGKLVPGIDKLVLICKRSGFSLDYLCGLRKTPTNNANINDVCEYTGLSENSINFLLSGISNDYLVSSYVIDFIDILIKFAADNKYTISQYYIQARILDEAFDCLRYEMIDRYNSLCWSDNELHFVKSQFDLTSAFDRIINTDDIVMKRQIVDGYEHSIEVKRFETYAERNNKIAAIESDESISENKKEKLISKLTDDYANAYE